MNLNLRHKLTKGLIRLLLKKIKNQADQPKSRPNTLSSIGFEKIMASIGFEFSHAKHVGLT